MRLALYVATLVDGVGCCLDDDDPDIFYCLTNSRKGREAFRELPVEDQNVIAVIGLEARIKEMGITENRRS